MKNHRYEWDIETVNTDGDIEDHHHSDKCPSRDLNENERLVLVRDELAPFGLREWAYVSMGKLPEHFCDAYNRKGHKVPQRFHDELAKVHGSR